MFGPTGTKVKPHSLPPTFYVLLLAVLSDGGDPLIFSSFVFQQVASPLPSSFHIPPLMGEEPFLLLTFFFFPFFFFFFFF